MSENHVYPGSHHHLPATKRPNPNRRENIRSMLSTGAVLLIAPLIAFSLIKFVFQPYNVDGQSMETTLSNNDRLIVWKVPRTWARITNHPYVPNRGDVIIFFEPGLAEFGEDPGIQLIKRVVGLPGEKLVVRDKTLTVYNQEHPEGFQPDATLPYGSVIPETGLDGEWDVGQDQVFVAGDNRGNSRDSRTFGPVDLKNVVGKLILRVLPLSDMKRF